MSQNMKRRLNKVSVNILKQSTKTWINILNSQDDITYAIQKTLN